MEENLTLYAMSQMALQCAGGEREEQELLEQELDAVHSALEATNKKSAKLKTRQKELKKRAKKDARLIKELKGHAADLQTNLSACYEPSKGSHSRSGGCLPVG